MYFSPQATVLAAASPAVWGLIATPARGRCGAPDNFLWLADNGCFTDTWNEDEWLSWLDFMKIYQCRCVMATAPDIVGDAVATLERFRYYAPILRARGWRTGLVAQDGLERLVWPDEYDALFIGGSTEWKLSKDADWCIRYAQKQDKWVHVGRVNSKKRIRHFQLIGVNSCDGTTICFAPERNFRRLDNTLAQRSLFMLE
jgi:hypothetical protein